MSPQFPFCVLYKKANLSGQERMEDFTYYNKIVSLITGEVAGGLTPEENKELADWLNENDQNRILYNRIRSSANFRNWKAKREDVDTGEAWLRIKTAIHREEKRNFRRKMLKYAALFLLPILASGGIFYFLSENRKPEPVPASQTADIKPGKRQAVLVLNDGKSVVLDSPDTLVLREKDGTMIQKGAGQLNYSPGNQKTSEFPIYNTIRIPRGGEYHLQLADGTQVFLNAESEFTYPVHFSATAREVELSGEAYFEVAPSQIPFIVRTRDLAVEVLGTAFNVNAYDNTGEVVTTLVQGKLKVDPRDKIAGSRILYSNDQAVLNMVRRSLEVQKVDVNLYTAWRKGELVFYNERLEEIMNTLTRWYSAEVFYLNPSVKELRFSGSLNRYEDINQILDIIASTEKVAVEINKTAILFSER